MAPEALSKLENRRYNEQRKLRAALLNQVGTALLAAAVFVPMFNGSGRTVDWLATAMALFFCVLLWYVAQVQLEGLRSED